MTKAYDVNYTTVTLTMALYLLATVVIGVQSNNIIIKMGLRSSLLICCLIMAFGCAIRLFIGWGFFFAIAGQFIAGMASPLGQNAIYFYCHGAFKKSNVETLILGSCDARSAQLDEPNWNYVRIRFAIGSSTSSSC